MNIPAALPVTDRHVNYKKGRLMLVSSLALATAGISASLRANTAADLQRVFFDPIDRAHSAEMIANILGVPFLGFALTIAIGSPLLDYIGMSLLLPLSGICFSVGMLLMVFASSLASGTTANGTRAVWLCDLVGMTTRSKSHAFTTRPPRCHT